MSYPTGKRLRRLETETNQDKKETSKRERFKLQLKKES